MKPRITWSGYQWLCSSRGLWGIRITGTGETPAASYMSWRIACQGVGA